MVENAYTTDRLFIQEIINALHKEGKLDFTSKSGTLLRDWSGELREKAHLRGRTKTMFYKLVGKYLWR